MSTDFELSSPMSHVFVDFENVPKVDLSVIGKKGVTFTLLLGAKQTKIDVPLVEKMLEHAASVKLVRLSSSGKNALDFALAYYLGRAALADPTAYFHVISKDTGFDPLIAHLKSRHVHAHRHADFSSLTFSGPPKSPPAVKTPTSQPVDPLHRALAHLRKNTSNRPRRKKTLVSHLLALGGKTATEASVQRLIERMVGLGHLSLDQKDLVTYHL